MNNKITHVVAAKSGTQKVFKARLMNVYIVHINWLKQSIIHFIRMFEPDFPLGSRIIHQNINAYCIRPIEVLELSNFFLKKSNNFSNVIRPSKLYMKEIYLQNPNFNFKKYEKYKYFFIQRKLLLQKIKKIKRKKRILRKKSISKYILKKRKIKGKFEKLKKNYLEENKIKRKKIKIYKSLIPKINFLQYCQSLNFVLGKKQSHLQNNLYKIRINFSWFSIKKSMKEIFLTWSIKLPCFTSISLIKFINFKESTKWSIKILSYFPNFRQHTFPYISKYNSIYQFYQVSYIYVYKYWPSSSLSYPQKKFNKINLHKLFRKITYKKQSLNMLKLKIIQIKQRTLSRLIKYLRGRFYIPIESIYIYLRKYFKLRELLCIGIRDPFKFYSGMKKFIVSKKENRCFIHFFQTYSKKKNRKKLMKRANNRQKLSLKYDQILDNLYPSPLTLFDDYIEIKQKNIFNSFANNLKTNNPIMFPKKFRLK